MTRQIRKERFRRIATSAGLALWCGGAFAGMAALTGWPQAALPLGAVITAMAFVCLLIVGEL